MVKPLTTIVLLAVTLLGSVAVARTVSLFVTELPFGYAVICGTIVWVMVAAVCAALQSQIITDPAANWQGLSWSADSPVGKEAFEVTVEDEFTNAAEAVCVAARYTTRADTLVGHRENAILRRQTLQSVALGNERQCRQVLTQAPDNIKNAILRMNEVASAYLSRPQVIFDCIPVSTYPGTGNPSW